MQTKASGFNRVDTQEIILEGIHSIVLMGDIGCSIFTDDSKNVFEKILRIKTDLFVVLGDIAFLGTEEEIREVIEFCNKRVNVPVYSLCGNHDRACYSDVLGLSTYALIFDEFVILALDNSEGVFHEDVITFTEEMLKKYSDKRFVITFHIPPPTDLYKSVMRHEEWEKLKKISDNYRDRIECMLTAHIHGFQEYYLHGYRIFISGGGGAALYDLEKDTLKSHHAIKLSFYPNETLDIQVVPV